jgi:hypothetical protein
MKTFRVVEMVVVVVVAVICASCAGVAKEKKTADGVFLPPPGRSYEVLGERAGLRGFVVKYDDRFYRGGAPRTSAAAKSLKNLGIKTVISVRPTSWERRFCKRNGFALVEIPFSSTSGLSFKELKRFLDVVRLGKGPFYVHSLYGAQRAGGLGVVYRLHVQGWRYEDAITEFGRLGGDLLKGNAMLESVKDAPAPNFSRPVPAE